MRIPILLGNAVRNLGRRFFVRKNQDLFVNLPVIAGIPKSLIIFLMLTEDEYVSASDLASSFGIPPAIRALKNSLLAAFALLFAFRYEMNNRSKRVGALAANANMTGPASLALLC
jgi:hypothetical protein